VLTGTSMLNGTGNAADNLLIGNAADNTLSGLGGSDVLQGGAGNDALNDTSGKNLFDGGAGGDRLSGGIASELFIGGKGNDTIATSSGTDMIMFNRGDGADTVASSTGTDNIISLGGGIVYADLQLSKSGNDLVFSLGAGDQLTFKDWYAGVTNRSVSTLQMMIEGTSVHQPGAAAPIHQDKIQWFDFDDLVAAFDTTRAANASITTWKLSEALLLQEHIGGSDSAAWGGDMAYLYAHRGGLAGIDVELAWEVLRDSTFGTDVRELVDPVALVGVPLLI